MYSVCIISVSFLWLYFGKFKKIIFRVPESMGVSYDGDGVFF